MHIEFLVEEPSAEVALNYLIPKIVGDEVSFRIHVHQGKSDLVGSLVGRLTGYSHWLPEDWRIVVLVDEDREDCHRLKTTLEQAAQTANLTTKTQAANSRSFQVVNRIAIEELEAWFFGDVDALCAAYPGVPITLGQKARYRNPDSINGGTWEALEQVLQRAGYYRSGLAKMSLAREISALMDPERNTSNSFRVFRNGLRAAVV